jgi:hypothetical protein
VLGYAGTLILGREAVRAQEAMPITAGVKVVS